MVSRIWILVVVVSGKFLRVESGDGVSIVTLDGWLKIGKFL